MDRWMDGWTLEKKQQNRLPEELTGLTIVISLVCCVCLNMLYVHPLSQTCITKKSVHIMYPIKTVLFSVRTLKH